jgi:signal transduction histidine kinase
MATAEIHVGVTFPTPIPRLGEELEVAVYRIAQEAVANAVRHADAGSVALTLSAVEGAICLEVRDDGRGFDRDELRTSALGLIAMEERAAALGGRLHIVARPGDGTTIRLECPLG